MALMIFGLNEMHYVLNFLCLLTVYGATYTCSTFDIVTVCSNSMSSRHSYSKVPRKQQCAVKKTVYSVKCTVQCTLYQYQYQCTAVKCTVESTYSESGYKK